MTDINEIKTWWTHLNLREQRLYTAGGIFLILLLLYLIIISPIRSGLVTRTENITAQKELLTWMQTHVPELITLRNGGNNRETISAGDLLSSVETSLQQSQLSNLVTTLQKNPDETNQESIQLKFNKVGFDHFMKWLVNFWQTYNIDINQISVIRTPEKGMIQITLSLSLPVAQTS